MTPSAPTSSALSLLNQHWQRSQAIHSPAYDWLGEFVNGDRLRDEIERERLSLSALLVRPEEPAPKGLVVGISLPDSIENLILGAAVVLEGICQAIVPIHAPRGEQLNLIQRFCLTHWIGMNNPADQGSWELIGRTSQGLGCWRHQRQTHSHCSDESSATTEPLPDPLLFLGTTSGTTGQPGLVSRNCRRILNLVLENRWTPYNLVTRPLIIPDLQNWSSRLNKILLVLKSQGFVCREAMAGLADHPLPPDCDGTLMAPGALRQRLARGDLLHCPANFLIISGSDRVPPELRRAVVKLGTVALGITYATSQTGPLTWLPPEAVLNESDSVGWLLGDVAMEPIEGSSGLQQGTLSFSEVLISTPHTTFNPGDLLAVTPSGEVIFGGRSNDIFLFNSNMISPFEIEDVLRQHPGVEDCAAFGAHSDRFGGIPMAAVIIKSGWNTEITILELETVCRNSLGTRRPRRLIPVEVIPRGSTGKALRRELGLTYALQQ